MQDFFRLKNVPGILFAPFDCDFIFELPCTSVESDARLHVKRSITFFSYDTETTRARTRYQVFIQQEFVLLPL